MCAFCFDASLSAPDVPVADDDEALEPEPMVSLVAEDLSLVIFPLSGPAIEPRTSTRCPTCGFRSMSEVASNFTVLMSSPDIPIEVPPPLALLELALLDAASLPGCSPCMDEASDLLMLATSTFCSSNEPGVSPSRRQPVSVTTDDLELIFLCALELV